MEEKQNKEINEVIDAQPIIKEILVANTDAIKRMYKEIKNIYKNKNLDNESKETPEEIIQTDKTKKCKFFNKGHFKYKLKSMFLHSEYNYLEVINCSFRHNFCIQMVKE